MQLLTIATLLFRNFQAYEERMTVSKPEVWVEEALYQFHDFLSACNCEEITCNGINVEKMVSDYFAPSLPFEEAKKDEFPDAITIAAIIQEIDRLSTNNVLNDHKNEAGVSEDMLYCVISADKGFKAAIESRTDQRPNEDVKLFDSLKDFINFLAVQNETAAELQEKLEQGYAEELIIDAIKVIAKDTAYLLSDELSSARTTV